MIEVELQSVFNQFNNHMRSQRSVEDKFSGELKREARFFASPNGNFVAPNCHLSALAWLTSGLSMQTVVTVVAEVLTLASKLLM